MNKSKGNDSAIFINLRFACWMTCDRESVFHYFDAKGREGKCVFMSYQYT